MDQKIRLRELNYIGQCNTTRGAKADGRHLLIEPSGFRLGFWSQIDLCLSLTGELGDVAAVP